jgi:multidrug transporter EmrE-like cation transporter
MGLNVFTLLVLGSAVSFTTGGIFMKLSDGLSKPWPTVCLFACFLFGACLQTLAMRGEDLGVTYIVVLGVEAILAFLFGWWLFGEAVTWLKVAAVGLIVLGIVGLRH